MDTKILSSKIRSHYHRTFDGPFLASEQEGFSYETIESRKAKGLLIIGNIRFPALASNAGLNLATESKLGG